MQSFFNKIYLSIRLLIHLHNFARLLPNEVQWLIMDFIDTGIDVYYNENMEEDLEEKNIEQDL